MSEHETVADIIREKREMAAEIRAHLSNVPARREDQLLEADSLDREADRIEAAWKRDEERAVEHATRHAEAVARDNCRDCVHNPSGKNFEGGNAAAMRKALEAINRINTGGLMRLLVELVEADIFDGGLINKTISIVEKARAALAAPARNCDRYEDAPSAYADFIVPWKLDGHFDDVPTLQDFANWLFAPAAERKGEGDGN